MSNFIVIRSDGGAKHVVNKASIDAIVYRAREGVAIVHVGDLHISIAIEAAENLELALGINPS